MCNYLVCNFKQADTLSRKKLSGNHPHSIYMYPEQPHPSSTHCRNEKKNWCNGNWPNEEKKRKNSTPGTRTWDLWNSRQGPYNCTTMYMISGHHSNMLSSISPNQRGRSKFYKYKVIFHTLTSPYKNFPLKWSVAPDTFSCFFFQASHTPSRQKLSGNQPITVCIQSCSA